MGGRRSQSNYPWILRRFFQIGANSRETNGPTTPAAPAPSHLPGTDLEDSVSSGHYERSTYWQSFRRLEDAVETTWNGSLRANYLDGYDLEGRRLAINFIGNHDARSKPLRLNFLSILKRSSI